MLQGYTSGQGVTKRYRLSWLTNSALVYEPECGARGESGSCWVSANEYTSTAVHRSPNKLWRSNSILNLSFGLIKQVGLFNIWPMFAKSQDAESAAFIQKVESVETFPSVKMCCIQENDII